MIYKTTLIVREKDNQLKDLGIDETEVTRYYPVEFLVEDIKLHHGFDHETDDGEIVDGTIIFFKDGNAISVLEPFEEISKQRHKYD